MLEKEEFKKLNKGFWVGFQVHMSKTRNVNDKRINWINYRSDVKSIFIRLDQTQRLFNKYVREKVDEKLGKEFLLTHEIQEIDTDIMEEIKSECVCVCA
jgi:hypothetical protein